MKHIAWIVAGLVLLVLSGCAENERLRKPVTYRTSARENFEKGKRAFEDGDYLEAMELFKFVKNKFPYSKYATESDLLMADCLFKRDKYLEAAEAYENFVKLHPRHPKVAYAMFQAASCHYEKIPSDWFLVPPAYEMDQTETRTALRKFQQFLARWPQHELSGKARKLLDDCKRLMANRSMYIAEFYRKREKYRGVVWRAEEILHKYSGVGFDEKALYLKAEALAQLGDTAAAVQAIEKLLERFPKGEWTADARKLLDRIKAVEAKRAAAARSSK
ncbi:MAG: outer membrane protein assembly factor BamD [Deltaproteobacteria bacterium]|nr:MAG: outer membrane protein assembly factor BamD [Deltaproteobacteria bacterium]